MTELIFQETPIPETAKSGRTAMVNPFTDRFPSDVGAHSITVKEGRESTQAKRLVRQARIAAKAVNRTSRVNYVEGPKGDVTMDFWTIPQITRKGASTEE